MTWLVLAVLALAGADDAGTRHVQPRHRRVFVQHVMRADGSLLCAHLRAARGCAYDASANCRPEPSYPPGELPTINLAATAPPGRLYDRAPFRRRESCGLVFDEPAWVHRTNRRHAFPPLPALPRGALRILLVREPWGLFLSYGSIMISGGWTTLANKKGRRNGAIRNVTVDLLLGTANLAIASARRDFLTQHLVPGYTFETPCDGRALTKGGAALDAYEVVLDVAADWAAARRRLARCGLLSLHPGPRVQALVDAALADLADKRPRTVLAAAAPDAFRRQNVCDYALYARGAARATSEADAPCP